LAPLVELGQALGGHVVPATVLTTEGLQHALALLAAPLLLGGELRQPQGQRPATPS
jgi:hypothetical protein